MRNRLLRADYRILAACLILLMFLSLFTMIINVQSQRASNNALIIGDVGERENLSPLAPEDR